MDPQKTGASCHQINKEATLHLYKQHLQAQVNSLTTLINMAIICLQNMLGDIGMEMLIVH